MDVAVIITEPISVPWCNCYCIIWYWWTYHAVEVLLKAYELFLFTVPSNTSISVTPSNDTTPSFWEGKVCDSFVRKAVTASEPSALFYPNHLLLWILLLNLLKNLCTKIVNGKLSLEPFKPPLLNPPVYETLPLTIPLPFETLLLSNEKFVTELYLL